MLAQRLRSGTDSLSRSPAPVMDGGDPGGRSDDPIRLDGGAGGGGVGRSRPHGGGGHLRRPRAGRGGEHHRHPERHHTDEGQLRLEGGPVQLQRGERRRAGSWVELPLVLPRLLLPVTQTDIGNTVRFDPVPVSSPVGRRGHEQGGEGAGAVRPLLRPDRDGRRGQEAFQLALWEILHDTNGSLASGDFRVDPSGTVGSPTLAQNWLNTVNNPALADPTRRYDLIGLQGQNFQDQITVRTPVPAPAGVVLLVIGAGVAIARRRFGGKKAEAEAPTEPAAA